MPTCCAVKDRKSTRLNSSHLVISYAVFCWCRPPPRPPLFPYTTLFRSAWMAVVGPVHSRYPPRISAADMAPDQAPAHLTPVKARAGNTPYRAVHGNRHHKLRSRPAAPLKIGRAHV